MIFYGTNASRLKDGQLRNISCPNCETGTTMNYSVFGKYAYIYWIPIFPLGKENVLECTSCKKTYKLSELPDQIKSKFELEKHRGIPIKHFAGLIIIAGIIGYFSYANAQHKEDAIEFSKSPKIGDIYTIEGSEPGFYSTMKVDKIAKDSVYLIINDYEIEGKSYVDDIDKASNYTTAKDSISIADVDSFFQEEIILDIERD